MAKFQLLGEKGLISKIGKRNLILISAVLFIALSVYLNYMWFSGAEEVGGIDYGSGNMSDTLGSVTGGDSTGTGGTADKDAYFTSAQISRQQARDEALAVLQTVLDNAEALESTKEQALADISAIASEIASESNVEALVVAKGFSDCVTVISGDSASVIVKSDTELLPSQVAQITEIVYKQTGILPQNLTIIRK